MANHSSDVNAVGLSHKRIANIVNKLKNNLTKADFSRATAPFYSNACKAVLDIKQGKATPAQWVAMLKKNGGLKAGEDAWVGLEAMFDNFDKATYDEVRNRIQASGRGRKRNLAPKAELQRGSLSLNSENPAFKAATEKTMQALENTGVEVVMATEEQVRAVLGIANAEQQMIADANERFNRELQQQIDGTLPKGHVYELGMPSAVLQSTGVPNLPVQLNSTKLQEKATSYGHDYNLEEIKDLVKALNNPMAVFAYGNKTKAQNIVVEIQSNGKNFVVGLALRPVVGGKALEINSIRNVFPKDNAEWLNWISQGKALYLDKEKIQTLISQQRTNLADVDYNHSAKRRRKYLRVKRSNEVAVVNVYHRTGHFCL